MSAAPLALYRHIGGVPAGSIPWDPDPSPGVDPPSIPLVAGGQGDEWQVAVDGFPNGGNPTVLYGATVEPAIKVRELGGNTATVRIPASPVNMRILGEAFGEFDDVGRTLWNVDESLTWDFLVGSTASGKARWHFFPRGQVTVSGGWVECECVGIIGGLTSERIIGAPERRDLLEGAGAFDSLAGWTIHGAGTTAEVLTGGIDGGYRVSITGTPDEAHYIERRVRYTQPARPWGRQRIGGLIHPKLPTGLDIDDYGLLTIGVESPDGSVVYWPNGGLDGEDPEAGVVTSEMVRGAFTAEPVEAFGYLPTPPFTVDICYRLHPVDEAAPVSYDEGELIRREASSTVSSQDLTRAIKMLFRNAQEGRDKSSWHVGVDYGTDAGISAVTTVWHQDGISLDEAIEKVCGQGCEVHDGPGPGRRVVATKRRGSKRTDIQVNPWDILASVSWRIDAGAVKTALRATSAVASTWGGSDVGAIDTSTAHGQIIDVIVSGPVGMTDSELRRWAYQRLGTMRLPQCTQTLILPWNLANRIGVGDSFVVSARSNSAATKRWMRATTWVPNLDGRWVAIDVGSDPEMN